MPSSLTCLLLAHLTSAAGAALVGGCRQRDGQEDPAVLAARRQRDSAYSAQLIRWRHDSTVLDSLTRLVRTDSLLRLYRRALEPGGVDRSVMAAIFCEGSRVAGPMAACLPNEQSIACSTPCTGIRAFATDVVISTRTRRRKASMAMLAVARCLRRRHCLSTEFGPT